MRRRWGGLMMTFDPNVDVFPSLEKEVAEFAIQYQQ